MEINIFSWQGRAQCCCVARMWCSAATAASFDGKPQPVGWGFDRGTPASACRVLRSPLRKWAACA
jgi:hypothetical protein